jgi:hypothetical protein
MKAVFYPVGGRKTASSRYRAWLLCDHRKEFTIGRRGDGAWGRAGAVIFQKQCSSWAIRTARAAKKARKLVVLDYSDVPLTMDAGLVASLAKMTGLAHLLTCSNPGDAKTLHDITGRSAVVVPNAQDLSVYVHKKKHRDKRKPIIVWMGHSNNMGTLSVVWPALRKLAAEGVGFEVLLVSDRSKVAKGRHIDKAHPVHFQQWKLSTVNATMLRGDVAINPQLRRKDGLWHKDRNKTVTAWACGLPCVDFTHCGTDTTLWRKQIGQLLTSCQLRRLEGVGGIEKAKAWGVGPVSAQWLNLLTKHLRRVKGR